MEDFVFVGDLEIVKGGSLFEEETEESLKSNLEDTDKAIDELKEQVLKLSGQLSDLEKRREGLTKKLNALSRNYMEIQPGTPLLTKAASVDEKSLFLFELFHGRHDVFAVRHWNAKTGKVSYFPLCMNAWTQRCLLKQHRDKGGLGPKPDCSSCNARMYEELTPQLIKIRQLSNPDSHGNNGIGIYPMLPGNVCRFVAIDLDEATWQNDALEIADSARKSGFQMAIERSFSGNGAHLWLFFSEDVPALKARRLAFSFLDKACSNSKTVTLKSYDRIFPAQDAVVNEGLGNLILMPLLAGAAGRLEPKGTVFVDNEFRTYPDQMSFLSSLPRYSEHDVDKYLLSAETSFGPCLWKEDDEIDVLWKSHLPKISRKDCLAYPLPVFLSAGISIPKAAMSAKLQDAFKRIACFHNPEYYKAIRRNAGFASKDISSFVSSFVESESVLQLPRGMVSQFENYLETNGIEYKISDLRKSNTGLDASFKGVLKEEQFPAIGAMTKKDMGILRAATSFGKTVVAAALIAEQKEKTLILVPKNNLLGQWKKSLQTFLEVKNTPVKREGKRINKTGVGIYGGGKDNVSGYVDVATFQTVASRLPGFIREYGMVIVDECHHVAADSLLKVMQSVCPRYVYGLSATVKRDDGLENLVYSQCGNVIFEYNADKLAYIRGIRQCFVPRFTSSTISNQTGRHFNHIEAIKTLASDDVRNSLIVSDAVALSLHGHKTLVLTGLKEHASKLNDMLRSKGVRSVMLTGEMSKTRLGEADRLIFGNECDVIVATGKYMGEGTDIPFLDTLLIATPVSWEGIVSQYAGRIAREYENKKEICIYDYVDICIPQFAKMYSKRLVTYRKLGYVSKSDKDSDVGQRAGLFPGKTFYTQNDVYAPFIHSIRCARKSIIICSPQIFMSSATHDILDELRNARERGVVVEIRTCSMSRPMNPEAQKEALDYLAGFDFYVCTSDDCLIRFATIDESELWFGDINFLGGAIKKTDSHVQEAEQKLLLHLFNSQAVDALRDLVFLM